MTLLIVTLFFSVITSAQVSITGIVSNDSIPLESASVIIKNSTTGIATNSKGEFKLKAQKGDTLLVSYLGYKTEELVLTVSESITFKLKDDNNLDEVVVIGYSPSIYHIRTSCGVYVTQTNYLEITKTKKNKLFPNPSSNGMFQLKLTENYNKVEISIANMSGRVIQNSTYQKFGEIGNIDLSQFSTGIYIVNIIADGKRLATLKAVRS